MVVRGLNVALLLRFLARSPQNSATALQACTRLSCSGSKSNGSNRNKHDMASSSSSADGNNNSDNKYLVTKDEIESMEGLHKIHFLNPNAVRINKSLGDYTGIIGFGFHIIEVEPGHATTEFHVHYYEDECVYVLQGTATAEIGDDSRLVSAGDFIGYRKGGLPHCIRNTGTELLRCIVVGERLTNDVADYPRVNKRIYRNTGMANNLVHHDHIETPAAGAKK